MINESSLFVLDVGHGNANVIRENGNTIVIDTGLNARLKEFLLKNDINHIQYVILSHSDKDHISGLAALLVSNIKIDNVILNADADKTSETWRDLIFTLDGAHDRGELNFIVGLTDGILNTPGFDHTTLQIVAPTRLLAAYGVGAKSRDNKVITSNSLSAVIRVLYDQIPIALLTGDMDDITLDEITKKGTSITARYLIFPHHGGLPGSGDPQNFASKLLDAVMPITVLFSMGRETHLNPNVIIMKEVMARNPAVGIGCTQLSKNCADASPKVIRIFPKQNFSAGQEQNLCCIGTIKIALDDADNSDPTSKHYREYVDINIPGALCRRI